MSPAPGADAGGVRQAPAKPRNGLPSVVRFGAWGRPRYRIRRPAGA